jgi:hypothetical protein
MRRRHVWRRAAVLWVGAAAFASGCAANRRPRTTVPALAAEAPAAAARERALADSVIERLARRAVARGDGRLDLLLLSGGGQHGAFGAGFLRAWHERADAPMPTFDLIAGISTGAMQAPFVMAGTTASLDTLVALYRRSAESFAPSFDWWFWIRRTGGLVSTGRLRRTVADQLAGPVGAQMRAQLATGRQLLIGTTDFDLGVGRTWDVAAELSPPPAPPTRLVDILMATSAMPGIFPPQVLDGHVHADGGVTANVLPVLALQDYRRLAARVRALGGPASLTVRLHAIWNTWVFGEVRRLDPSSALDMKARSDALVWYGAQPLMMARLHDLAPAVAREVPGLVLEVRHVAIPAAMGMEPGARTLFNRDWMRRLEQLGRERALAADPWDPVPSAYARP